MWHIYDTDAVVLSESRRATSLSTGYDDGLMGGGVYAGPSQDFHQ